VPLQVLATVAVQMSPSMMMSLSLAIVSDFE